MSDHRIVIWGYKFFQCVTQLLMTWWTMWCGVVPRSFVPQCISSICGLISASVISLWRFSSVDTRCAPPFPFHTRFTPIWSRPIWTLSVLLIKCFAALATNHTVVTASATCKTLIRIVLVMWYCITWNSNVWLVCFTGIVEKSGAEIDKSPKCLRISSNIQNIFCTYLYSSVVDEQVTKTGKVPHHIDFGGFWLVNIWQIPVFGWVVRLSNQIIGKWCHFSSFWLVNVVQSTNHEPGFGSIVYTFIHVFMNEIVITILLLLLVKRSAWDDSV